MYKFIHFAFRSMVDAIVASRRCFIKEKTLCGEKKESMTKKTSADTGYKMRLASFERMFLVDFGVFRCVLASLKEGVSIRRSVGRSVGPSVRRSVHRSHTS